MTFEQQQQHDKLNTHFEAALWDLRRKKAIHFNTLVAKCRRINSALDHQQVSSRLKKAIKEKQIMELGNAKYKVNASQTILYVTPPSPPPSSPMRKNQVDFVNCLELVLKLQQDLVKAHHLNDHERDRVQEECLGKMKLIVDKMQGCSSNNNITSHSTPKLLSTIQTSSETIVLLNKIETLERMAQEKNSLIARLEEKYGCAKRQLNVFCASLLFIIGKVKALLLFELSEQEHAKTNWNLEPVNKEMIDLVKGIDEATSSLLNQKEHIAMFCRQFRGLLHEIHKMNDRVDLIEQHNDNTNTNTNNSSNM